MVRYLSHDVIDDADVEGDWASPDDIPQAAHEQLMHAWGDPQR